MNIIILILSLIAVTLSFTGIFMDSLALKLTGQIMAAILLIFTLFCLTH